MTLCTRPVAGDAVDAGCAEPQSLAVVESRTVKSVAYRTPYAGEAGTRLYHPSTSGRDGEENSNSVVDGSRLKQEHSLLLRRRHHHHCCCCRYYCRWCCCCRCCCWVVDRCADGVLGTVQAEEARRCGGDGIPSMSSCPMMATRAQDSALVAVYNYR